MMALLYRGGLTCQLWLEGSFRWEFGLEERKAVAFSDRLTWRQVTVCHAAHAPADKSYGGLYLGK